VAGDELCNDVQQRDEARISGTNKGCYGGPGGGRRLLASPPRAPLGCRFWGCHGCLPPHNQGGGPAAAQEF